MNCGAPSGRRRHNLQFHARVVYHLGSHPRMHDRMAAEDRPVRDPAGKRAWAQRRPPQPGPEPRTFLDLVKRYRIDGCTDYIRYPMTALRRLRSVRAGSSSGRRG